MVTRKKTDDFNKDNISSLRPIRNQNKKIFLQVSNLNTGTSF